ncbi:unnamed protein product [Calicophoron daubneyi]|uniref:Uncharacterized protein n=1 Tax=Calicophoron daubneyi TaxID=300641 RepID=A0AAV2TCJ8_CALDB
MVYVRLLLTFRILTSFLALAIAISATCMDERLFKSKQSHNEKASLAFGFIAFLCFLAALVMDCMYMCSAERAMYRWTQLGTTIGGLFSFIISTGVAAREAHIQHESFLLAGTFIALEACFFALLSILPQDITW